MQGHGLDQRHRLREGRKESNFDRILNFVFFLVVSCTGTPPVNVMYAVIHDSLLLLHGGVCVVGLPGTGLVLSSWTEVGPRSNRKQVTLFPFGGMGSANHADNMRSRSGQSRRYVNQQQFNNQCMVCTE